MASYNENSTEPRILDFDLCDIVNGPSSSTHVTNIFPGILDEDLENFILKNDGYEEKTHDILMEESYNSVLGHTNVSDIQEQKEDEKSEKLLEAKNTSDSEQWIKAVNEELETMKRFDAYEVTDAPVDHQVVSTRSVLTKKFTSKTNTTRYKARLVVRVFELKCNYREIFAPTPQLNSLKFDISYCASK